jgi:hypothetical protein
VTKNDYDPPFTVTIRVELLSVGSVGLVSVAVLLTLPAPSLTTT